MNSHSILFSIFKKKDIKLQLGVKFTCVLWNVPYLYLLKKCQTLMSQIIKMSGLKQGQERGDESSRNTVQKMYWSRFLNNDVLVITRDFIE